MKPGTTPNPLHQAPPPPLPLKKALPAAPPRRRISERVSLESQNVGTSTDRDHSGISRTASLNLPPQSTVSSLGDRPPRTTEQSQDTEAKASHADSIPVPPGKAKQPPVPPPRKKRVSRQLASTLLSPLESPIQEASSEKQATGASWEGLSPVRQAGMQHLQVQSSSCPQSSPEFKGSQASLSDSLGVPASAADQDSYSTSSAEEELEFSSPNVKKKPSMILDKARHRLSFVSFASVFHAFLSSDRKLYKKVVELAQDKSSYFGSLVQDYKVYSLEMMARQTSSTEMLQEIRTMMTQLKSYLLQSTELKALVEPTLHSEEELGQWQLGGRAGGRAVHKYTQAPLDTEQPLGPLCLMSSFFFLPDFPTNLLGPNPSLRNHFLESRFKAANIPDYWQTAHQPSPPPPASNLGDDRCYFSLQPPTHLHKQWKDSGRPQCCRWAS